MKLNRSALCLIITLLICSINAMKLKNSNRSLTKASNKNKEAATLTSQATSLSTVMANMRESVMSKADLMSKEFSRKRQEVAQQILAFNTEKSSEETMITNSKSEIEKLTKIKDSLQNINTDIKVATTKLIDILNNQEPQQMDSYLSKEKEIQSKLASSLEEVKKEKTNLAKQIESNATQLQSQIIANSITHNEENFKLKDMDKLTLQLNSSVEKEKELILKTIDKQKQIDDIQTEHVNKHKEFYGKVSKEIVNYEKTVVSEIDNFKRFSELIGSHASKEEFIESFQPALAQLKEQLSEAKNSGSCELNSTFNSNLNTLVKNNNKFKDSFKKEIDESIHEKENSLLNLQYEVLKTSKKILSLNKDQETFSNKIKFVNVAKNQEIQNLELMAIHTGLNEITKDDKNMEAIKQLYTKNMGLERTDLSIEDINQKQRKSHQFAEAIKETIKSIQEKYISDLSSLDREKENILKDKKMELETKMKELANLEKKIKLRDKNLVQLQSQNQQTKQETELLEKKKSDLIAEIKNKENSISKLEKSKDELKHSLEIQKKEIEKMKTQISEQQNQNESKIVSVTSTLDDQANLVDELSNTLQSKIEKLEAETEINKKHETTIENLNTKIDELNSLIKKEEGKVLALTKINETLKTVRTSEEKTLKVQDSKKAFKRQSNYQT